MERAAGICGPGPRQYGASAPESEPETKALVNLCRERCVSHVLAFHSQGEEIYSAVWLAHPPAQQKNGRDFRRLKRVRPLEAPSSAWLPMGALRIGLFRKMGRPGFTFEVGKGRNPLPCEQLDSIYERLEESLLLAAVM